MHKKVSKIDFPRVNEIHVKFVDTFADLLIPVTPEMDRFLIINIFYRYMSLPESRLKIATNLKSLVKYIRWYPGIHSAKS